MPGFIKLVTILSLYILSCHCANLFHIRPKTEDIPTRNYPPAPEAPKYYDFIIVGVGTAGCVLATRLSEISGWTVLAIESGKRYPSVFSRVPIYTPAMPFLTQDASIYQAEYQPNFGSALLNQKLTVVNGNVVGGSSQMNAMIYTRGHRRDFDRWALAGNIGWSYNEVEPYFLKSENANNLSYVQPGYHRTGGLLSVSDAFQTPMGRDFVQAGVQMGYPAVDYTATPFGFSTVKTTTYYGRRADTATSYIDKSAYRPNLEIKANSYVTEIIINSNRAVGVKYVYNGLLYTVYCRKEVILSAGARNSPKLLMLSGIGPRAHLNSLNINVKLDLPVGQFMKDHPAFFGLYFITNSSVVNTIDFVKPRNILQWFLTGTGPLASTMGVEALAYIKTSASPEIGNFPDIELFKICTAVTAFLGAPAAQWGMSDPFYSSFLQPLEHQKVFMIIPGLMHTKSVGRMELASNNSFEVPKFYPNYYYDPQDMQSMLAAIAFTLQLVQTPAMKKYNVTLYDKLVPGCENKVNFNDYWTCALLAVTTSYQHQVGTCRMGISSLTSVVDPRLKVHGMPNLRVVDVSVMPDAITAHTCGPAVMIAEKAGDIIKQDYNMPW